MMKRILIGLLLCALLLAGCAAGAGSGGDTDLVRARRVLIDFFEAVAEGEYQAAVDMHGENADFYQFNRENNPDVDPEDRAALLEAACSRQLLCLMIGSIISEEQLSNTEFLFVVEFVDVDGNLFVMGPCCGEDESSMPSTWEFEYRVEKTDSGFFVIGGPLYVP